MTDYLAKAEITEVIYRYCRAMDRMDRALALSCWHDGATDDHAPLFAGSAPDFIDFVFDLHEDMIVTRHDVANILISLDGDRAGSESYWQVLHQIAFQDQILDIQVRGRYVDRFEKRDGRWAITHRQSIRDWSRVDAAVQNPNGQKLQPFARQNNPECPETIAHRNQQDYSYRVLHI